MTTSFYLRRDKRAYIATLLQDKFYFPRQAAANVDRALGLPQWKSRKTRGLLVFCGSWIVQPLSTSRNIAARAIQLPQCTRWNVVHLMHFGSCIAACVLRLVHCGSATVGIDGPQYKPFYTVSFYFALLLPQFFPQKGFAGAEQKVKQMCKGFNWKFCK